ncbi:MAG: hypothetical protein ABR905_06915 [Terracidiphilus sp.]
MTVIIVAFSVALFATFMVFYLIGRDPHYNHHSLIRDAAMGVGLVFGAVGGEKLKRGGNKKLASFLFRSALICLCVSPFVIFPFKRPISEYGSDFIFCAGSLLFGAQFPLALYLNRKQNSSRSEPTIADAR